MTVERRDVPGYPGYQVGDDGSVWSEWRTGPAPGQRTGAFRQLKPWIDDAGRPRVGLNQRDARVCTLVLLAFVGPKPPGKQACHRDGNPANNAKDNLRWGTAQENAEDRAQHGRTLRDEAHPNARLTNQQVEEVRALRESGLSYREIAARVGMSISQAHVIVARKQRLNTAVL